MCRSTPVLACAPSCAPSCAFSGTLTCAPPWLSTCAFCCTLTCALSCAFVAKTETGAARKTVKRIRAATSIICGSANPRAPASLKMESMPLPHRSTRFSSRKTLAITWLRILDVPCFMDSRVIPASRRPGFSISIRSSKKEIRMGALPRE